MFVPGAPATAAWKSAPLPDAPPIQSASCTGAAAQCEDDEDDSGFLQGEVVSIRGLTSRWVLNGRKALVLSPTEVVEKGRVPVKVLEEKVGGVRMPALKVAVKRANLARQPERFQPGIFSGAATSGATNDTSSTPTTKPQSSSFEARGCVAEEVEG